jgi:hypothetical protein
MLGRVCFWLEDRSESVKRKEPSMLIIGCDYHPSWHPNFHPNGKPKNQ